MRKNLPYKKKIIKHLHYKIKSLKRYFFKIFLFNQKIKQFIVKLFFFTNFIITFAHPFKKAC